MAIYDFSKAEKELPQRAQTVGEGVLHETPAPSSRRDQLFAATAARLFFLLLLVADVLWICFALAKLAFSMVGYSVTAGKVVYFKELSERAWVALRRSFVCGVSLMLALFSPAFGVMVACTYFLMYDKTGIEEVVPSSLQSQFKEFLPKNLSE
jgi:hypothetical protein